jgi:RHS repeat-associated protein
MKMRVSPLFTALGVFAVICVVTLTTAQMRVSLFTASTNSPPIAVDDNYTVHGSLILKPLLNDADPDGDTIFFNGVAAPPQHGALVGVGPGQLQYTANDGYVGSDSFTYTVRDGSIVSAPATVTINVVNQAPLANPDSFTVHGSLVLKPPLNDIDPDGDPFVFAGLVTQPQHGTLLGANPGGEYQYTANDGYVGSDSFTYKIRDSLFAYATGTVTIDVVNQAPLANPDSFTVHGTLVLKPPLNDTDPDGDAITFTGIETQPQHGTLVGTNPGGEYQYQANDGYVGSDSFTYKIRDTFFANATGTVSINVVNQAPFAKPDSYDVRGNLVLKPPQNDTDADSDPITFAGIVTLPQHGTLVGVNPGGEYLYTAAAGYVGSDSFTYKIRDSLFAYAIGTVTLNVIGDGENDGPCPCHASVGAPVNVTNGNMYLQQGDYALPSVGPGINITRTYNSNSQRIGLFGRGWSSEYDESIVTYDASLARLNRPDGRAIYLGRPVGSSGVFAPIEKDFHGSLVQNGGTSSTITTTDGSVRQFNSTGKLVSLSDRIGNQTSLAYDSVGKLASVTDPFGRVLSFTTNSNGQVLSISDTMGSIATYTYGTANKLLSVTYADSSAFQFAYDANNRLITVKDSLGNIVESHTYDGQGRALTSERQGGVEHYSLNYVSATETAVTDALSHVTKYTIDKSKGRNVVTRVEGLCNCGGGGSQVQTWTYDNQLNVTAKTDALNHVISYSYDANGNRLSETDSLGTATYTYNGLAQVLTVTDKLNGVTTNTYDASGNLLTTKNPLNNTTAFTYSARGQVLTATDARGKMTSFTYDVVGNLTQSRDANGITTFYFYDARNRLTKVRDPLSRSSLYAYDAVGRLNKLTHPDLSFVTFNYDLAGRRTSVVDERGNVTSYAYDGAYRLTAVTDALNHATTSAYDAMSNLTSTTDALGRLTNFEYDDFNRLKKITYPPASTGATRLFETVAYDAAENVTKRTDTAGRVTNYSYDNVNRLASTSDADNKTTSFEYDALSRTTALTDPLNQRYQFAYDAVGRQIQVTRAGVSMSYAYDAVGNPTQLTDYNGAVTSYVYDNLNRLTTIAYPTRSATFAYDPLNNLTRATNENGSVYLSYDNRYRLSTVSDPFYYGVSYNYDAAGNRTKLSLNYSTYASYTYDAVNRLTNLKDSANQSFPHSYDTANRLTSRGAPNGVTSSYAYDGLDRLTALTHAAGATTLIGNQYQYNDANNISNWTNGSGTHTYGYDLVDRLTSATNSAAPNENYSYDGVGNRTASHLSVSYSYQPFNKMASAGTGNYTYDNNGNVLTRTDSLGTTTFSWSEENQLTQVSLPTGLTVNYKYDALGRRIQRTTTAGANERYVYDGNDVLLDLNAGWSVATTYLNGPGIDNHLRQTNSVTGVSYFLTDHLGSTAGLTDAGGNFVEQQAYDSFGNSAGSTRTRYGYTGRERDPDTGLMYYRARWYDPQVGRFISEDPIGLGGGINSFAYVSNNSVNFTDPFGLWSTPAHNEIIKQALAGCLTEPQQQQLKDASRWVDRASNQFAATAYQHGMRAAWQSVEDARNAANRFIAYHQQAARNAFPGGCKDGYGKIPWHALWEFGKALHTLMDMTSPSHEGFQIWHDPPGPPLTGVWGIYAANHHRLETKDALLADPTRLSRIKKMVREEFAKTFGDCGCCSD